MLLDDEYTHLCLPMAYAPKFSPGSFARFPGDEDARECPVKTCVAQHREHLAPDDDGKVRKVDPRTEAGQLLDPVRKPADVVARLRRELGSRGAAAQLDQTPSPSEGAIFKRHQIRYYRRADLPTMQKLVQSWDMTFKQAGSSFVCGQVWGQHKADSYLLDQVRDKWGFSGSVSAVKALTVKWPKARKKYVEAKANGNAVVDHLQSEISGFELVEPEGGKEARANACEPQFESGNVWLPHPDEAPWVVEYVEELLGFPAVVNDDQVDTTTQALVKLYDNHLQRLRRAMQSGAARQIGR
jgi:predicted phage terminase large subunit-like protein